MIMRNGEYFFGDIFGVVFFQKSMDKSIVVTAAFEGFAAGDFHGWVSVLLRQSEDSDTGTEGLFGMVFGAEECFKD